MPVLDNQKEELVAQGLAKSMTQANEDKTDYEKFYEAFSRSVEMDIWCIFAGRRGIGQWEK